MVTTPLVGQLGNQCFQIATAISYAKEHGHQYHIPLVSSNERHWPATFKHLSNQKYSRFADTINLYEKGHNYSELPYDPAWADSNIVLNGYFQSEKYFEDHIDEVRLALNIPYSRLDNFVGIHVRRGDYLRFPKKHPVVTFKYLLEAVEYFVERGYKSFVVCSDDMLWTKEACEKIKKDIPGAEFSYSTNRRPIDDMMVLMCCDYRILANSSFSLFSDILCPFPEKFCIAPETWFGSENQHLSVQDLYPLNCVKL